MSFFDSAKDFFGLGPVDHGEDDAYYDDPQYAPGAAAGAAAGSTAYDRVERPERPSRVERAAIGERREPLREPARPSYRATTHIVTAAPRNYNDAKEIGEPFRDGDAVVMDLTDLETADAKRIVDFAAGLCFALRGNMHNLSRGSESRKRVFAIVPENARVEKEDLKRAAGLR